MPQNDTFFLLSDKAQKNGIMKHHHYSCGLSHSYSDDRVRNHALAFSLYETKCNDTKKACRLVDLQALLWALTDSNRRPSACKADALNQLS